MGRRKYHAKRMSVCFLVICFLVIGLNPRGQRNGSGPRFELFGMANRKDDGVKSIPLFYPVFEVQDMPRDSNRVVYPPEGWTNSLAAEYIGPDQFGNGEVYDARLDGEPFLRLIYDQRDEEITVRCLSCDQRAQPAGRFTAYPMIGIVSINATELLVPMNTPRIMRHLADRHEETLYGMDDMNFFNCLLDSCGL